MRWFGKVQSGEFSTRRGVRLEWLELPAGTCLIRRRAMLTVPNRDSRSASS